MTRNKGSYLYFFNLQELGKESLGFRLLIGLVLSYLLNLGTVLFMLDRLSFIRVDLYYKLSFFDHRKPLFFKVLLSDGT